MGLAQIDQSIKAFVDCVLDSQVKVRSSILGLGGHAKEAQTEFLVLVEDAIRQLDLAKSVQHYQLAVDKVKFGLNLAVSPGAQLIPGWMVINTENCTPNRTKACSPNKISDFTTSNKNRATSSSSSWLGPRVS